ncbi:MAG: c-type cytochrome biogenesis protein CcmI [Gammaproteobacteria bacterium]|nr:MAG: c-type cytochrome biogenesis protein CcmI [Gammaproteobacteria bacterium]
MWFIFGLLSLVAATFVIYPLFSRSSRQQNTEHPDANVVLYQEQLTELDRQLAAGEIDSAQHAELVAEQQRLLLADENLTGSHRQARGRGAWLILAGLVIVPLFAFSLYQMLGASDDVAITKMMEKRLQGDLDQATDAQLREQLTQRISRRLLSQPDNIYYLVSLARLQLESGDMLQSSATYQKAVEVSPDDPDLLAEYAQSMYFASGNKFVPSAENALDRALSLDPNNLTALGLQGIRAFESADYKLAIASWQSALRAISPATPQAQALQAGIARAKQQLGEDLPGLQVQVTLSPELTADPELLVYVFAREWQGPPMPLAVTRLQVADLPATVVLDDTMAMPGGKPLSSVEQVQVVARVSQSGSAIPAPGDLEGVSGALSLANGSVSQAVTIDRKL